MSDVGTGAGAGTSAASRNPPNPIDSDVTARNFKAR
jgi:hypothetical protein